MSESEEIIDLKEYWLNEYHKVRDEVREREKLWRELDKAHMQIYKGEQIGWKPIKQLRKELGLTEEE